MEALAEEIKKLLPKEGLVLIAGLGNYQVTPDALGPKTASLTFATRHIQGEIARSTGLDGLRPVAVLAPGVLGQTGMETGEILASLCKELKPSAVIVVDAMASRKTERVGTTIQICDTGISPGSGVGNARPQLNSETLGVPVIAMGVPTVVDAKTLAADLAMQSGAQESAVEKLQNSAEPHGTAMIVTPREIDLLIERAAKLLSLAINTALHPDFTPEDFALLVG
jgi:spore protease